MLKGEVLSVALQHLFSGGSFIDSDAVYTGLLDIIQVILLRQRDPAVDNGALGIENDAVHIENNGQRCLIYHRIPHSMYGKIVTKFMLH